ncbi:MAG: ASCH domain-containing protein [Selenomonadaceae bacterium]|nr:ASCH domain-containing protein [Selenomonadaceae bacterium]
MKVLFSINPEHVQSILSGKKQVEYRKTICRRPVDAVLIYSTSPVQMVVAQAKLKKVLVDAPDNIWELTKEKSGISRKFFMDYFASKKYAVAYELEDIEKFPEPKPLRDFGLGYVPQSFAYVS